MILDSSRYLVLLWGVFEMIRAEDRNIGILYMVLDSGTTFVHFFYNC
jgi:hypothetical protein